MVGLLPQLSVSAQALGDSIPDALLAVNPEGRILLFNRAAERLFGYSAEEAVGQLVALLTASPMQLAHLTSALGAAFAKREAITLELQQRKRDGSDFSTSVVVSPFDERAGRGATLVMRTLGTPTDRRVTPLVESVAGQVGQPYREVFDHVPDALGVFEARADGHFVLVEANPAFVRQAGVATAELIGTTAFDALPVADAELAERKLKECLAGPRVLELDERRALPIGKPAELRSFHTLLIPLGSDGRRVLSVSYDVTEHKRAEEASRKLSRAVEQSPTSIVITDRDGLIEYANPRFSQVTGYSIEEVKGKNPRIFKSGETSPEEYAALWRAIASGQEWHGEFHNRKKNGELYWESASISPVLDASGVITHFVAVKEDITETKRLLSENLQVQKMKAFTQLAAGIAHDFNNLLTVIQGNLSVVVDGDLSQDQSEAIGDVGRAAQRAAELTRQLLTFSRRKSPILTALDLNELLGEVVKTLGGILGEQVEVEVRPSPEARVLADRSMIEQVLVNLALNARDAMPKGGRLVVSIEPVRVDAEYVRRSPRARQGDFVELAVADTGTGIAPAVLSRLFEPFFTTKELGKGSGLGLATVFGIVEQHQGWVTVDSEVGQGTSVRVLLPRLKAREEVRRPSGALVLEPKGGGIILVAEDQPEVRAMVVRTLSMAGYEVLEAASAAEAHAIWEKEIEHIVLLVADVVLPGGVSGRQLAERLMRRKPALQVLYVSGYTDEAMREELGKDALFLEKPFTPAELLRRVRLCLPRLY